MKTVLITGATSGIGESIARKLAKEGNHRLVLCGRRLDRLKQLETELSAMCDVSILSFDVADRSSMIVAIDSLPDAFSSIDVLINNAGNAHGLDPINTGSIDDWELMIDINLKGLLYLTRKISPQMVSRKSGQIINIGSIAGKEAYANGNVYCATKAAVDTLTVGMRMDLFQHNIRVSAIHPGLVETEFSSVRFKGDSDRAMKVYEGMTPLGPDDIANSVVFVMSQPEHVVIADMLVLPTAQASATQVHRE